MTEANLEFPTFIPLKDAAKHYALTPAILMQMIDAGKIRAGQIDGVALGYIRTLGGQKGGGRGNKRLLNETDVAYTALLLTQVLQYIIF